MRDEKWSNHKLQTPLMLKNKILTIRNKILMVRILLFSVVTFSYLLAGKNYSLETLMGRSTC